MTVSVDICLRGDDFATTREIHDVPREPGAWHDDDVRMVLQGMLRAMHELKHPGESNPAVVLRGLSWIVNPFEDGGVVIAIEISMGAAVAGPFDIDKSVLDAMITRVLAAPPRQGSPTVH